MSRIFFLTRFVHIREKGDRLAARTSGYVLFLLFRRLVGSSAGLLGFIRGSRVDSR
jgi:hypothetical protein